MTKSRYIGRGKGEGKKPGRRPSGREQYITRLTPKDIAYIKRAAVKRSMTQCEIVGEAVDEHRERRGA